jgi:GT2 family glycosyltransferase
MIDDGSEDESVKIAKNEAARTHFAHVDILELKHNGVVSALNVGLNACKTDIVFRIDGDATVETPHWDTMLKAWLREFPEVGLVGGQVVFDDGRIHSLGRAVLDIWGLRDMGCWPYEPPGCRTFDAHVVRPQCRFVRSPAYEVDTILGVCVAFRRGEAIEAGGFDPRFNPVWIEDDDFGLQIRRLGCRVVLDPAIRIVHRISLRNSRQPGLTITNYVRSVDTLAAPCSYFANLTQRICKRLRRESISPSIVLNSFDESNLPAPFAESSPWRMEILRRHYESWHDKWGFDPLNPDPEELETLVGKSATLGWRFNVAQWPTSRKFARRIADFSSVHASS